MKKYHFSEGDRVRIMAGPSSSTDVKEHNGEVVTIKARCSFTWAYELVELPGLWCDGCFCAVN